MLSFGVSGRWCRGIVVKSGVASGCGKSIFFHGVDEWESGAEEAVFVRRYGEYLHSGKIG